MNLIEISYKVISKWQISFYGQKGCELVIEIHTGYELKQFTPQFLSLRRCHRSLPPFTQGSGHAKRIMSGK